MAALNNLPTSSVSPWPLTGPMTFNAGGIEIASEKDLMHGLAYVRRDHLPAFLPLPRSKFDDERRILAGTFVLTGFSYDEGFSGLHKQVFKADDDTPTRLGHLSKLLACAKPATGPYSGDGLHVCFERQACRVVSDTGPSLIRVTLAGGHPSKWCESVVAYSDLFPSDSSTPFPTIRAMYVRDASGGVRVFFRALRTTFDGVEVMAQEIGGHQSDPLIVLHQIVEDVSRGRFANVFHSLLLAGKHPFSFGHEGVSSRLDEPHPWSTKGEKYPHLRYLVEKPASHQTTCCASARIAKDSFWKKDVDLTFCRTCVGSASKTSEVFITIPSKRGLTGFPRFVRDIMTADDRGVLLPQLLDSESELFDALMGGASSIGIKLGTPPRGGVAERILRVMEGSSVEVKYGHPKFEFSEINLPVSRFVRTILEIDAQYLYVCAPKYTVASFPVVLVLQISGTEELEVISVTGLGETCTFKLSIPNDPFQMGDFWMHLRDAFEDFYFDQNTGVQSLRRLASSTENFLHPISDDCRDILARFVYAIKGEKDPQEHLSEAIVRAEWIYATPDGTVRLYSPLGSLGPWWCFEFRDSLCTRVRILDSVSRRAIEWDVSNKSEEKLDDVALVRDLRARFGSTDPTFEYCALTWRVFEFALEGGPLYDEYFLDLAKRRYPLLTSS